MRISARRAAARIASRSRLPRSVDGHIRGAYADPIEGHHRLDRPTLRAREVRHKIPRAEVVQCVTAAARLLCTECNELHRKRCWLLAHHRRQLEHHGNSRRIVFRAGCHRHSVEMGADNNVGFVRLEALGSAITLSEVPLGTGVPQEVPDGTRNLVRRTS